MKAQSKAGEYGILVVGGLAAIYLLSYRTKDSAGNTSTVAEDLTYNVSKKGLEATAGAAGGVIGGSG